MKSSRIAGEKLRGTTGHGTHGYGTHCPHAMGINIDVLKKELIKQPKGFQMPKYMWIEDHAGKRHKSKEISKIPDVYNYLKL